MHTEEDTKIRSWVKYCGGCNAGCCKGRPQPSAHAQGFSLSLFFTISSYITFMSQPSHLEPYSQIETLAIQFGPLHSQFTHLPSLPGAKEADDLTW